MPQRGVIALTGATGYIGRATVQAALSGGYGVVALARRPLDVPGVEFQRYDLKDEGALSIPPGCIAILHLAADTHAGSRPDIDMEMKAATRIVGAAREYGLPLVFVSSQTAAADAATDYGRAKWRIEQIVLQASGCIVRPGLVYGGEPRGLFGQLFGLVKTLPVLPSFLPAPVIQPIHVNDLAAGLVQAVEQRSTGVISLAQDDAVTFTDFLRILASDRLRRPRIFVPFPAFVLSLIAPIAAAVPGTPDLGRIWSLYAMKEMRTVADLQKLGIRLRSLDDGMHCSGCGRRRRQLREAKALLTYVLRQAPPSSLLRRYVHAIDALYVADEPLALPALVRRFPMLLAAYERAAGNQKNSKFRFRLSSAILIAEASPLGARRFMLSHAIHPITALFQMAIAVTKEGLMRIVCVALAAPLKIALKKIERETR